MFVLVNGKIYNSDDSPILLLFTQDEVKSFRNQPEHIDIHCSFPPEWGMDRGKKWMESHRDRVVKAKIGDAERSAKRRSKLPISMPRVIPDEVIKTFMNREASCDVDYKIGESSSSSMPPFKFPKDEKEE